MDGRAILRDLFSRHGSRFGVWRAETIDGRKTKVPRMPLGRNGRAKSNDPSTWDTLPNAELGLRHGRFDGLTVFLGDLNNGTFLIGCDFDLCRSPTTGEIMPWARQWLDRLATYTEVSPSGTGVKAYGIYQGKPPVSGKEITLADEPIPEGAGGHGHETPEIGLYCTKRFFALTGLPLAGTPLELRDVTAPVDELVAAMEAKKRTNRKEGRKTRAAGAFSDRAEIFASDLPQRVTDLLKTEPEFARAWETGVKLGPGGDESASGKDFSLAVWLYQQGVPFPEIAVTLRLYRHGQIGSGKLRQDAAARRIGRIMDALRSAPVGEARDDERPEERLAGGWLHKTVERCERIAGVDGDVHQRGSQLVRVARRLDPSSDGIRRSQGSLGIVPYDVPTMRLLLNNRILFKRFDKRSQEWHPADCPKEVAEALLAAVGAWPSIPPLLGIIEAPTLRPDGSVLDQPGYDRATGLYLDVGNTAFPEVPQQPSRDEAQAALAVLTGILAGFPFASEADRSVAVSMILTALVRRSLRAAPMSILTAPKMGSGKSLLATVASYIASGRAPAMMSQADDTESERKRVLAILMEGDALALIDNVERPLGSDTLCSVLTEPIFRDRLLGQTKTITVPTCTTWAATGNNITIAGDLTTRVLICRIDPQVERPEERTFQVDLHQEVPARRGELAVAALTIIRAYLAAGSPKQELPTFGRFEAWQQWCRFPLVWLGMADPCLTRAAAEARDPVREKLSQLTGAWYDAFGSDEMTLAAAIKQAPDALRDAMHVAAGDRDGINLRKLGWFVARHEGRIEDGRRFEKGEGRRTGLLWRVVTADELAGFATFASSPPSPYAKCQSDDTRTDTHDNYIEWAERNPRKSHNPRAEYVEGVI
ncbi:hypothetical protein [Geminicoccus roseus]|uniref:hypothetical protein n=1 Tax=Geminicoccus roseus TaxID=404900 RepID=UPI000417197F|nr:hypothetical protein [Geminicoccus roseus]